MLYILLAGGVFNAVLVPQLVRAMKNDADGGAAYADRIVTLAVLFLGTVTVLLVVAAPWVMDLLLDSKYDDPALAAERQSAIDFARLLPAAGLLLRHVRAGRADPQRAWAVRPDDVGADRQQRDRRRRPHRLPRGLRRGRRGEQVGGFTHRAGGCCSASGSTLGIVAQFLILMPYLRAAGVRIRPRFDFRGTGLGHTLRLGGVDGAVRDRQPGGVRRRGPARLGRHRVGRATAPASPSTPRRSWWRWCRTRSSPCPSPPRSCRGSRRTPRPRRPRGAGAHPGQHDPDRARRRRTVRPADAVDRAADVAGAVGARSAAPTSTRGSSRRSPSSASASSSSRSTT